MRRHPYSTSIGIVVIVMAGVVAAGCMDNRGLPPDKADAGLSDAAAGRGGQAGSISSRGGTAGTGGVVQSGGVAGTKATGGTAGIGGSVQPVGTAGTGGGVQPVGTAGAGGGVQPVGTAGTKGTAGTTSSPGTGGTAGSVDAGGAAGTKGTGGAGSGGTVGSGGARGGNTGVVDAAVDVPISDGSGRGDGASDAGAKDALASETRAAPDSSLMIDARVVCPPVCLIYCAYGNVLDANGCPTCACNPAPTVCPAIKCKACSFGYLLDASGCQTCTCAPDPNLPCSQYSDATSCGASATCRWIEPGCNYFGTLPLPAAICHDSAGVGCTASNPCPAGQTCVQWVINPCSGGVCQACGSVVGICTNL
jgi:hypothetical protein